MSPNNANDLFKLSFEISSGLTEEESAFRSSSLGIEISWFTSSWFDEVDGSIDDVEGVGSVCEQWK